MENIIRMDHMVRRQAYQLQDKIASEFYTDTIFHLTAFRFANKSTKQPREIFSTTIRIFKGLERGVVVLLLEPV
jgi:hypothetical protein